MASGAVGQSLSGIVCVAVCAIGFSLVPGQRDLARAQSVSGQPPDVPSESQMAMPGILRFFSGWGGDAGSEAEAALPTGLGSWHRKTTIDIEPSAESWAGLDGYRRVASLYAGVTWSPFGNLRQDGPRVRILGGESFYKYGGRRYDSELDDSQWVAFTGRATFMEALAGWQISQGATTVKLFGGMTWTNHRIAPYDTATGVQGAAKGAKAALEVWHNWSPKLWTSLDVSAAQVHRTYAAQLRVGWRFDPSWSAGPEASLIGHTEAALQRAGGFLRYESLGDEFTISGGHMRARGDIPSAYGTVQYLRRF